MLLGFTFRPKNIVCGYNHNAISIYIENRVHRTPEDCLSELYYIMLSKSFNVPFIYQHYNKSKKTLDASRKYGHLAKGYGGMVSVYYLFPVFYEKLPQLGKRNITHFVKK